MFKRAERKLEDTCIILKQLKATRDALSFRSLFNSFLNASRAITFALQKEGKHIAGFSNWYGTKQEEMRSDNLLRFLHEARKEDFHEGKHRLSFTTYIKEFSSEAAGTPPSPNAKMAIGGGGPFWIVDEGTPQEQRIPIKQGGNFIISVSIANAPTVHQGKKLTRNDPITVCKLALDYFSELVYEAKTMFV